MASPPIPPQLDHLITRPFSFYPPIIGIEHNEWLYRKASWSEILVVNCKSGGGVPFQRRVIEMPLAGGGSVAASAKERPAPGLIVGIRMASAQDKRIFKLIGAAATVAILLYVLAVR